MEFREILACNHVASTQLGVNGNQADTYNDPYSRNDHTGPPSFLPLVSNIFAIFFSSEKTRGTDLVVSI